MEFYLYFEKDEIKIKSLYIQEVLISLNGQNFLKIHISGNKCLVLFHAYQGNSRGFEEDLQFSNDKSWPWKLDVNRLHLGFYSSTCHNSENKRVSHMQQNFEFRYTLANSYDFNFNRIWPKYKDSKPGKLKRKSYV